MNLNDHLIARFLPLYPTTTKASKKEMQGNVMGIATAVRTTYEDWAASLDASDHMALLAVGLGLILFSVAALLVQSHLERRFNARAIGAMAGSVSTGVRSPVLGQRHIVSKSSKKGDAFLRRLEEMST